jgi:PIN domain nuclease of toxin-antitoxin system
MGSEELSREARHRIDTAPVVYVSSISAFEVAVKAAAGKLKLPTPAGPWWIGTIEHHGLSVLPIDADICLKAAELPPVHRDPADRLIVATALLRGKAVVTADRRFADYGVEVLR